MPRLEVLTFGGLVAWYEWGDGRTMQELNLMTSLRGFHWAEPTSP